MRLCGLLPNHALLDQGGAARRLRRRPPPGSGLGRPRPARSRLLADALRLIMTPSRPADRGSGTDFLAPDCPSRGQLRGRRGESDVSIQGYPQAAVSGGGGDCG